MEVLIAHWGQKQNHCLRQDRGNVAGDLKRKKVKTFVSISGRIKGLGNLVWLSDRIKAQLPYAVMN